MQKHAFLCQRNCIYVYVTRKVYHGICGLIESVVDTPVDIGFSVLADMYNWQQLVCVTCPLLHSVGVKIVFRGLILPVVNFSLITGLYVGMSNIRVSHLWSVTWCTRSTVVAKHPPLSDYWQTLDLKNEEKPDCNIPAVRVFFKKETNWKWIY